jgi:hypothetical protein
LILAVAIAIIEAFDILFDKLLKPVVYILKPKFNTFLKTLYVAVFGYRLYDLRKLILYFKNINFRTKQCKNSLKRRKRDKKPFLQKQDFPGFL